MQNKKVIIIGTVALCIIIIAGVAGFIIFSKGSKKTEQPVAQQDMVVPTVNPSDIGFSLTLIQSGKFAKNGLDMKITKVSEIASIDYELDYTSQGNIPRGAIGHVDVKPTDSAIDQQLPFGTCSDVCHFDSGITDIKVTLKITNKDGSVNQLVSPFSL